MKFLLFSDFHYAPGMMTGKALGRNLEDLRKLQQIALNESCDFIIHGGDLVHGSLEKVSHFLEEYNSFSIPSYHCLGNHETDNATYTDVLSSYNLNNGYYYFDCKGYRIIVIDSNYYCINGEYSHYSNEYSDKNVNLKIPYRDFIAPEQLLWLKKTIEDSPFPCITISHQSFCRESDGIKNQYEVRKIINDANKKKAHSVILCMNGHNHCDHLRILDGVLYFEVNSASGYAITKRHSHYPSEEVSDATWMNGILAYDSPLYAIVTTNGTTIDIRGTEAKLHRNVTIDMTEAARFDKMGRTCEPIIRSAKVTL